jgi:hypothetical protein
MKSMVCPACESCAFESRETIEVEEQHKDYAPHDKTKQQLLNAAIKGSGHYQMVRCVSCGLEFSDPLEAPFAEWYDLAYSVLNARPTARWEFGEVLRHIPKEATLFEFGCGPGSFLSLCADNGIPAWGMDFSKDAVAGCLAKGLKAQEINLDEMAPLSDSRVVSQIASFHFVEHLARPASLFEHAATLAQSFAHLWVSVPSNKRPTRRYGLKDFLDQPPHHMTRWTEEAFREIGKRHGWRLVETIYEPLPLLAALWSIWFYSRADKRRQASGKPQGQLAETAHRLVTLPGALMRRLGRDRDLSGFSMLAHFVLNRSTESSAAKEDTSVLTV